MAISAATPAGQLDHLAEIGDAIKRVRDLTESRFLALGDSLEASIDILSRLAATFQALRKQLESEALKQVDLDISRAASGISALSGTYNGERDTLAQLVTIATGIGGGIGRMRKAVKAVDVLGVSAKIEATRIGDAGVDFLSFADEIDRSLKLAQVNLFQLADEIAGVQRHLAEASLGEREFDKQHGESIRLIPGRLTGSVESIAAQRVRAVAATTAVADRSAEVGGRISEAVMALQIGDTTRQRIEHVEQAIAMLDSIVRAAEPAVESTGPAQALDETERRRLVALGCRLQAAQLIDAAAELDQEVGRVVASLGELRGSAHGMVALGEQAYGASDARQGTLLLELEADVAQAQAMLNGFRAGRANADQVVGSVKDAATRLVERIGKIQSLEADIRIMGLNTTFKCGRLGRAGRALSVIAQELRTCANLTATEADAVIVSLEQMMTCLSGLSAREEKRPTDTVDVGAAMENSVARLGAAGRGIAEALAGLKGDSDRVCKLLEETIRRIDLRAEISAVLRQAADDLGAAVADLDADGGTPTAAQGEIFAAIAACYTMAQERAVHARLLGEPAGTVAAAAPSAAPASGAVDDFLF